MENLEEQIRQWVIEACKHPSGSPTRQRYLTKVIRHTTSKLWRDSSPYYQDALQQTWVYFCQNVCERGTGERYDPNRSSVTTWLNSYLKRRLQDFFIDTQKQQARKATGLAQSGRSGDQEILDPLDMVAAEPDAPPILNEVQAWAEADATGELRRVCIEGHPHVNCQLLILRRLPPETSWKDLANEFGLSVSTLSSFYQRQCLPRLRKFGESEGYL
ncbi:sigma-70 family RNA polymerase sigma factor [Oscillatoria sp. FACHB-1407]|uniref:sigma-70 family RNA polymerase sigma factor n=1 Tax=Oscillatoria sp. FACHB-1407 TaxID=2692847 RepID=UPI001682F1CB|nr:sigma-70 family RNA polymerase sigma factor [Oscillatoria sp. FACHB-1407]MBD2464601.1 sigma-70 family RNA polymerase sigma factor [Oscillatoria sp. FACHB-1407]